MKLFFLIYFVPFIFSQDHIPDEVREQLHNVDSVEDLFNTIDFSYDPAEETSSHDDGQRSYQPDPKIAGMSDEAARRLLRTLFTHMGNDTCHLQSVCIPHRLPMDNVTDYFPPCYEVNQCVGSCCDSANNCIPTGTKIKKIQIGKLRYAGKRKTKSGRKPTFDIVHNIPLEVIEHTSCACKRTCKKPPSCKDGYILGPNCECERINRAGACTATVYNEREEYGEIITASSFDKIKDTPVNANEAPDYH